MIVRSMMIVRPMIVRLMMVVRLSGHPLIQDSLREVGEDSVQQQHDGVLVVEERGAPAGLRQAL